jgi:hypothetical protein
MILIVSVGRKKEINRAVWWAWLCVICMAAISSLISIKVYSYILSFKIIFFKLRGISLAPLKNNLIFYFIIIT